jgi:hypothetical protein
MSDRIRWFGHYWPVKPSSPDGQIIMRSMAERPNADRVIEASDETGIFVKWRVSPTQTVSTEGQAMRPEDI